MKLESVLRLMIITLVIPVLSETIFTPVVSKYFLSAANVEVIASASMASQAITLFIAFVGCWGSGLKIFMRLYYPMWITEIAMAIIIAMMGAEHVEMRFYLDAVQNALCVGIEAQSLEYYAFQVIPKDIIQTFSNKRKTVIGGAGIAGSFFAVMMGNIDIHIALWADVVVSIFGFFLDTFVLHNFKRILKEEQTDQKL